jgi:branched-chain amino acid transport system substrate-binding protein
MKKQWTFGLLLLAIAAFLISRFAGAGAKGNENVVRIGATLDETSEINAVYGKAVKNGMLLALEEIRTNGSSSIDSIIFTESASVPDKAIANFQKMHSLDGVKIFVGEVSSNATKALVPLMENNGTFLFAPASSSPDLAEISKNFARNWPSDDAEAGAAADYIYNNFAAKNAVIVYVNSEYGKGLKNTFSKKFAEKGGKILSELSFEQGNQSFSVLISKLKTLNFDALYLAGNPKEQGYFAKQLNEQKLATKIVSNTGFAQKECLEICKDAGDGVIVPSPSYDLVDSLPTVRIFVTKYQAKYGTKPTLVEANGYDAVILINEGIKKLGHDPLKVAEYIRNRKKFYGASGEVNFTNGEVTKLITYSIIKNGKVTPL